MLKDIDKQLEKLYSAYESGSAIAIATHMYIEGDPINFIFTMEDNKFSRLTTVPAFSEWMANSTGAWKKAAPSIQALASIYGVSWDNENGALFLRFRRNEMSVAEAVMRLQQAVAVVCMLSAVR